MIREPRFLRGMLLLLGLTSLFFIPPSILESQTGVPCPSCGMFVGLQDREGTFLCNCGHEVDLRAIVSEKAAHLQPFQQVSPAKAGEQGCLSCHEGIDVIHPKMAFIRSIGGKGKGCVICHEGDAEASGEVGSPRDALVPNPGEHVDRGPVQGLRQVPQPEGHRDEGHELRERSPRAEPSRVPCGTKPDEYDHGDPLEYALCERTPARSGCARYANLTLEDPLTSVPVAGSKTYKTWVARAIREEAIDYLSSVERLVTYPEAVKLWGEPAAMMVDYYRKECARCHVWTDGAKYRGDRRAGGCSACHVLYSNDAFYQGGDPAIFKDEVDRPLRHQITIKIPSVQCTRCHTRGKRIGTSFVGIMEFPYESPWRKDATAQWKLHKKRYFHVGPDVHFERGIDCADCHTSIDVHGDGNIYPTTDHAVEIECEDCHGTPKKYPWELPVGHGDALQLGEAPRGILHKDGKEYLLTARGNPFGNVVKKANEVLVTDSKGKVHETPLAKSVVRAGEGGTCEPAWPWHPCPIRTSWNATAVTPSGCLNATAVISKRTSREGPQEA